MWAPQLQAVLLLGLPRLQVVTWAGLLGLQGTDNVQWAATAL